MREITSGVYLIEELRGGNVYALVGGEGLTLIDGGLAGDEERIAAQLEGAGHSLSKVHILVLTHAHGDHVGGAVALARRSGAQVVAHRDEVPYLERRQSLPAGGWVQRLFNWLSDHLLFRLPPCPVDRAVQEGDTIAALGGLRVIHTPGHTPGSMCLYQRERQILFCGDALFNEHPMTGRPGPMLPVRLFTADNARARASAARLVELEIEMLCSGHGAPITAGAGAQIRALLQA
jgi:glyoxylase-like metal-dependent hydrolase (beta-lactamase superfamily II)